MAQTSMMWSSMWSPQGGLYGGDNPYHKESGTTAAHYFGERLGARKYENRPTTMFASGSAADVVAFNEGVRLLESVSNQTKAIAGFTWDKATNGVSPGVGTWDSDWTDLFTRINANLSFNTAVVASGLGATYGGFTEDAVGLIIDHEVDQPKYGAYGTQAQYRAYVRHVHNLMVAAGIRDKFRLNFCITEFGLHTRNATIEGYYPGDDVIDELGIDFYGDFNASWVYDGSLTPASTSMSATLAFVRLHNKPFNFPEFAQADSGDTSAMETWWAGFASTLNAATDVTCNGIYLWCQASGAGRYENFNYLASDDPAQSVAHVGVHTGMVAAMGSTAGAGNAKRTSGSTSVIAPAPTGLHLISLSTDGTEATVGWDAAPVVSPAISGSRAYLAPGVTVGLHRADAAAGQPDSPSTMTTFTYTGLTPNTTYSYSATWDNAEGNSGFAVDSSGNVMTFKTAQPGSTAAAPNITVAPTVVVNATDSLKRDFAITATDPNSESLSYAWTFTSPSGAKFNYVGATGTTDEFTEAGNWSFAAAVTNTDLLSNTATGNFSVVAPGTTTITAFYKWAKPQTGDLVRTLGPKLRNFMDGIDAVVHHEVYRKRRMNKHNGLVGASFESAAGHSTNTQTLTSGWAYWVVLDTEDDTFDEIWLNFKTAQVGTAGTGSQLAVYDSTGLILPNGVYTTGVNTLFTTVPNSGNSPVRYSLVDNGYQPENFRTPGERLYVVIYNSGATTAATLRVSSAPSTYATIGDLGVLQPSFGGWDLGTGGLPTQIPWGSYVSQLQVWAGLGRSDLDLFAP